MRTFLLSVLLLAGCGNGTTDPTRGIFDHLQHTDTQLNFIQGDSYVILDHWRAVDAQGTAIPVADVPLLSYTFDDSLAVPIQADSGNVVPLNAPFTGYLYLFGPTSRDPLEQLGAHYLIVR